MPILRTSAADKSSPVHNCGLARSRSFKNTHHGGWTAFEQLEQRQMLDAIAWTGAAGDNLWHTPENWLNQNTGQQVVPTTADDVTIDIALNPTISFNGSSGNRSVRSLLSRELLDFSGGSLAVGTTATLFEPLQLRGGTLAGGRWDASNAAITAPSSGSTLSAVTLVGTLNLNSTLRPSVTSYWRG